MVLVAGPESAAWYKSLAAGWPASPAPIRAGSSCPHVVEHTLVDQRKLPPPPYGVPMPPKT